MELSECIKGRRSIRKFTAEPVSREALERVVALASCAPSWKNSQPARYTAVADPALKQKIAQEGVMGFAKNTDIIQNAPLLVVLYVVEGRSGFERDGTPSTSKGDHWQTFDAGIAAQTFCLAAHAEGLGSVILGIFDDKKVAQLAGLPAGQQVAALIAVGHPAEAPDMPRRKTVEELLVVK